MRYTIGKPLGRGAFAWVYEAEDDHQRKLAVKLYGHANDVGDIDIGADILREINILHMIRHQNIIQLMQVQLTGSGRVEIVMEHGGATLSEYMFLLIDFHREERAREMFPQLLSAVAYIHKVGIIHRDIKPENILIRDNTARLCDFSIAKKIIPYRANAHTYRIGSSNYKPPELFSDISKDYGTKIDIWSLGCTFYEFLTKTILFTGSSDVSVVARILRIMRPTEQELSDAGLSDLRMPSTTIPSVFEKINDDVMRNLIRDMVRFRASERITAEQAHKRLTGTVRSISQAVRDHNNRRYGTGYPIMKAQLLTMAKQTRRSESIDLIESMQSGQIGRSEKQTFLTAVSILDQYTCHASTSLNYVKKNWEIIACCCYFLASKYIELRPLKLSVLESEYNREEIISCEKHILKSLQFVICNPTLLDIYKVAISGTKISDDHWNSICSWVRHPKNLIGKNSHEIKNMMITAFSSDA